ncbi:c-type cytochrome biogenesis protein CcmI [Marinobacter sp.]|uniref:c-type cytochrome biogenesis protein CcmI n=1 Tax=Marinobacter sp. TaxID=50741 RepID=UPI002B48B288|nr:c-type cytochrome biogenesis protein CcmI [Marinobacter sp.]HKK55707.1 c-type cytochrome biogenesis protein CcmI [Marinobacter sp.]
MIDIFWITTAVLILVALAFIAYPLISYEPGKRAETDVRNQNLLAYRTRMAELDGDYEAGNIDEETYQQLKDELAGAMLDDVPDADQGVVNTAPQEGQGRAGAVAIVLVSLVAIPVTSVLLYQQWGAKAGVEQFRAMQEMSAQGGGGSMADIPDLAARLRDRLEASPDNPEGWGMLARTYMQMEQYADAAWAYQRLADVLAADSPFRAVSLGLSAQAGFFDSQGEITPTVRSRINEALAINPDEVNALGLLAFSAFHKGNFEEAISRWERIVEVEPDHPRIADIRQGIARAYQELGREAPAPVASSRPVEDEAGSAGVTVRVEVADAFNDDIPRDAVLFLFAREAGAAANSPPLAVARLSAAELPAVVRLDDRYAMRPSVKVSTASEVMVAARVSRSGNAMPEAGDWQGSLETPIAVSDEEKAPTTLVIDQQLTD